MQIRLYLQPCRCYSGGMNNVTERWMLLSQRVAQKRSFKSKTLNIMLRAVCLHEWAGCANHDQTRWKTNTGQLNRMCYKPSHDFSHRYGNSFCSRAIFRTIRFMQSHSNHTARGLNEKLSVYIDIDADYMDSIKSGAQYRFRQLNWAVFSWFRGSRGIYVHTLSSFLSIIFSTEI